MISPSKISLSVAASAVVVTWVGLHLRNRREIAEVHHLREENSRLAAAMGADQRGPVAGFTSESGSAVSDNLTVSETYREEGQATPEKALQSLALALDRADVDRVKSLIVFESNAARAKVAALLGSLAPTNRWRTPEDLAATVLVSEEINRPYPDASILQLAESENIASDRVRLRLPGSRIDNAIYQKAENGWRFVVLESAIDTYLARLSEKKTH